MSLLNDASLVFIPSGYKEDKVYSVIPSNGAGDLDFVRGCNATRVNPQSLVENTPWNLLQYSEDFSNAVWQPSGASVTTNQTTAPNGTNTGDKFLIDTSNSEHVIFNSSPYQSVLGQYTTSVYLKYGNTNFIEVANNGANGANYCYIIVNLTNGAVTQSGNSGSYTLNSYDVTSVGDGWYRCSITYTVTSDEIRGLRVRFSNSATPTVTTYGSIIYTGNGTDFVYAWGAQLNIGSTAKPYFPTTDRLNVPRLTYSPTLIERQSTNLALYSQDFTNGVWTKRNNTIASNVINSPIGDLTADKIQEDTSNDRHDFYTDFSCINGITYTNSIYVKQAERRYCFMSFGTGAYISGDNSFFDLQDGVVISSPSGITSTITSVGNGWYRCSIYGTAIATGTAYLVFGTSIDGTSISYQGVSGYGLYIWGAQIETGSLTSYIPTTSTAVTRVASYNSGCPSLLLEKQSTNLFTYSEQFDNVSWIKSSTTITSNTTISPSGLQDADTAVFGSNGQTYKQISLNAINTFSIYVKKGTNQYFSIQLETNSVAYRAIYDLDTTTVTFTGTNTSALITDVGNGWFRVSVVNTTSDAILYATIQAASSGTSVSGGSGTFYIWGAQLEVSSYPTSYIPTTSAQVTRLADSCSKAGISSLIGQTEGTLFIEYPDFNSDENSGLVGIDDGSGTNRILFYSDTNNRLTAQVRANGVTQQPSSYSVSGRVKAAIGYNSSGFVFYINGVIKYTGTSVVFSNTMSQFTYNHLGIGSSKTSQALLFKRRLTNTELANLTTL